MRYVQVNTVPHGSTGSIMMALHEELLRDGEESWVFWGRGRDASNDREFNFGTKAGILADVLLTRFDGRAGFHSRAATRRLLAELDRIGPDVVHLHNLHGYYLNIEMLFEWLAERDCQVRWTLHDCWPLTGHCVHFTYVGCDQWKQSCAADGECSQLGTYPKTYAKGECFKNHARKKALFTSVPSDRMRLFTPTKWLADRVSQSFLKNYPVEIRENPIDSVSFRPRQSDFRERYGLEGKTVVLGVAFPWTERKGLGEFVRLAGDLGDEFAIVLVGLSKKQRKRMPGNILAFERTDSKEKLAEFYTAADLFVNPSIEETFGLTVAEALACGTTVAVRKDTACAEVARFGDSIYVDNSYEDLLEKIQSFRYRQVVDE